MPKSAGLRDGFFKRGNFLVKLVKRDRVGDRAAGSDRCGGCLFPLLQAFIKTLKIRIKSCRKLIEFRFIKGKLAGDLEKLADIRT